ncbi:hypothetical protein [Thioalkalivibrio sp. ALMg13-2]|uniref:hypothetical protein n=1 Tax=Thioalkalivibrio sp. ALMg13-2 TaxID=1158167 RepID=UPI00037BB6CF|nr:hypothetical protein [Thioalkalivibrio sp. ALMg13-2]
MIILFATQAHRSTHRSLERHPDIDFRVMPYERLLRARRLPQATYIFSDLDRLHFWDLECVATIYRQLRDAGARVVNNPARHRSRYQLLRHLKLRSINEFNVWHADDEPPTDVYPVFLRTDSAHRGTLTDLLHTPVALRDALEEQISRGVPRREIIVVQYAAEPVREGLYRKLAAYRIGDRVIGAPCAHQETWVAKYGQRGIAPEELYEEEYKMVTDHTHADAMRPAFQHAEIEYGRADFGLFKGKNQVYEINTNPFFYGLKSHPFKIRLETFKRFEDNLVHALSEIDTPSRTTRHKLPDGRTWRAWFGDLYRSRRLSRWPRLP